MRVMFVWVFGICAFQNAGFLPTQSAAYFQNSKFRLLLILQDLTFRGSRQCEAMVPVVFYLRLQFHLSSRGNSAMLPAWTSAHTMADLLRQAPITMLLFRMHKWPVED